MSTGGPGAQTGTMLGRSLHSLVPLVRCSLSLPEWSSGLEMGFGIVGLLKIVVWGRNSSVALWREEALIARDEQPSSGSFCATLASYNCDACSSGGRLLAGVSAPPPPRRAALTVSFLSPQYRATALPAFKYYVTCACLIFFCIFIVQILVLPK